MFRQDFICLDSALFFAETFRFASQLYQNSPQQCSLLISLYFRTFLPKWLIFFGHFKTISAMTEKKFRFHLQEIFWTQFFFCSTKDPHPIYRTSNMVYGSRAPSVHTVPTTFKPRSQKFSTHLGGCGMYRNNSLNTYVEKSVATGPDNAGLTQLNRLDFHKSYSSNPNV